MLKVLSAVILTLATISCIKVNIQSETPERRTQASELQGKDFRVQFAERMRNTTPAQKFEMTRNLIDSVTANYLRYGRNVAEQWRQASAGRGQVVSDAEMRDVITNTNLTQQPLTQAYEESIDYGIEQIKLSQGIDPTLLKQLQDYRDHFYKVYNGVFFPKGTVTEYDGRLSDLQTDGETMSRKMADAVRQLR